MEQPWWQGWWLNMGLITWAPSHYSWFRYCHHWMPNLLASETDTELSIWQNLSGQSLSSNWIMLSFFHSGSDSDWSLLELIPTNLDFSSLATGSLLTPASQNSLSMDMLLIHIVSDWGNHLMATQELHTFYIVQYVALSRKGQSAISQLIILEFFCQGSRKNKKIELLY